MKKVIALMAGITLSLSAQAGVAFLRGEMTTGMTKQCFYDYLGNTYTRTIASYQYCPYSITI
jgi:predicted ABC-type sugar transport system permease subunit